MTSSEVFSDTLGFLGLKQAIIFITPLRVGLAWLTFHNALTYLDVNHLYKNCYALVIFGFLTMLCQVYRWPHLIILFEWPDQTFCVYRILHFAVYLAPQTYVAMPYVEVESRVD